MRALTATQRKKKRKGKAEDNFTLYSTSTFFILRVSNHITQKSQSKLLIQPQTSSLLAQQLLLKSRLAHSETHFINKSEIKYHHFKALIEIN